MNRHDTDLMAMGTLVLWMSCLIVGVTGLVLPHQLPSPPKVQPPPLVATMLNVTISNSPASPTDNAAAAPSPPADQDPTPAPTVQTPSNAPPLQAVAKPSPTIAFALPTRSAGPSVSAATAVPSRSGSTPGPSIAHLVFGQGKGQQPAPEYPREAALAGEEGTVIVQFTVDAAGRVDSAFTKQPCRSALLNQAAVRTIRDSWRFKPGPPMTYDISIVFQLAHP